MIRTLIEVTGADEYEFDRNMKAALAKLGYEQRPTEDHTRWMRDLWQAMREKELDPQKLVQDLRAKLMKDGLL